MSGRAEGGWVGVGTGAGSEHWEWTGSGNRECGCGVGWVMGPRVGARSGEGEGPTRVQGRLTASQSEQLPAAQTKR